MKRLYSFVLFSLLLVVPISGFAANVIVDGREWRQVNESIFTDKSSDTLAASCDSTTGLCADGTNYEGLRWASRAEVLQMWDALAGTTGLGATNTFEAGSAWAPLIVGTGGPFLPTDQVVGVGARDAVYGWTRDRSAGQGQIMYVIDATSSLANDAAAGFTFSSSFAQFNWGAWMYVTPVPEPESHALLLAGLGLIGLIARGRKSRRVAGQPAR